MVVDCWLLTRTLAPKKRACDMLRHICLHHQNSITGSCKAFALQHFRVSESTTFIGFFKCNLSRQKLSYFLNNHAIIKSKHVIFMILIALTDVTNYESWIPEVNAFRRLSIPPSKVLGTARLSYAVGARLFTHIWCAWTPWCEFIWVGQGLPEPCSNTTGYGGVNADVVKLDHIFDHLFTTTIVGPDVVVTLWNWYMGAIFRRPMGWHCHSPPTAMAVAWLPVFGPPRWMKLAAAKKKPQFQLDRRMDLRMFVKNCMCNEHRLCMTMSVNVSCTYG